MSDAYPVEHINPRLAKRGDTVVIKGTDKNEVVRAVSVVLHMANGQDLVYDAYAESVDKICVPDLDIDADVEAIQAAARAETEESPGA